ncbi:Purine efflux pump PbuE [Piscirickettsiaceae bacterium NZ-RLO1]|nr:Purine efflux pump PbuE [Piscirickettsiaceae bacterium NZ-RLO1]
MYRIIFLTLGMFALGLDAYVVAGILSNMSHSFGATFAATGQSITAFTLCYAVAAPITAALFSGKPARKVLFVALTIFSIANIVSALATSLSMLLVSRALAGLGAGLFSPMAAAVAAMLVPAEKKGRALGLILGGMSTGTVIGVPIGLLVNNYLGWRYVFIMVACIGFIGIIGILFKLPDIPVTAPPSLKQRLLVMSDRKITATVGVSFLTAVASLGLYTYISPVINTLLSPSLNIVPYLWCWGIGGIIGSLSIGTLIDKTGKPSYLLIGILSILTLGLFSIPLFIHLGILAFLPFILWGAMGWSSLAPQQHTLLSIQPQQGAAVVALNGSCNYLGSAVGAMLGGVLISYGVLPAYLPYWAGVVSFLALISQIFIVIRSINKTKVKHRTV